MTPPKLGDKPEREAGLPPRATWTELTDNQLLAQCAVDTYRASGPGGQKRNKTSSAVRLRHTPTGIIVIAEESRSQYENKAKALVRLRQAFYLKLRESAPRDGAQQGWTAEQLALSSPIAGLVRNGKLNLSRKHPQFWPAAGVVLDLLADCQGRVSDVARLLGISTGNLVGFLETHPRVWQEANQIRLEYGCKPLHTAS